ncbi:hypothetical protein PtA15_1A764 [Puccinia triticina]|uniref:Fe2OG dioxygenase domain-containing protein n=1 Tax=Puccinia triticina TaxID=208348 RepID=A0ABY7C935_9BASI|nr:uncharacterized protein PtA15_1A764 [Puccinia triticina]WAQ81423.1 hypothetical protein PtA15_1A764 [Puccinia triticina]WAR52305.1 hypothetical protein PtB15_1B746 [Puccinia triticina]
MATFNLDDHRIAIPIPSIHLVRDFISAADESYLSGAVDRVGNSNAVVKPDLAISVRAGGWQRVNGRRSMYWGGTMTPKGRLVPQSPPSFMTDEWPRVFQRLEALKIFSAAEPSSSGPPLPPNHCLVNEYAPGDGILPHLDGPAYLPTVATISLESDTVYEFYCYSDRYEHFSRRLDAARRAAGADRAGAEAGEEKDIEGQADPEVPAATGEGGRPIAPSPLFSLFVPRRSLIIISGECYEHLLHSIPARPADLLSSHLEPCLNWPDFSQHPHPQLDDQALARGRRVSLTCRRVQRVVKGLEHFLK